MEQMSEGLGQKDIDRLLVSFDQFKLKLECTLGINNIEDDKIFDLLINNYKDITSELKDVLINRARYIVKTRRQRDIVFELDDFFGEPAWEILLDLYIAKLEYVRLSVTNVCIESCAPMTTALRYITRLCERGIVHRVEDETDKRRVYLELSEKMLNKMTMYLARMPLNR